MELSQTELYELFLMCDEEGKGLEELPITILDRKIFKIPYKIMHKFFKKSNKITYSYDNHILYCVRESGNLPARSGNNLNSLYDLCLKDKKNCGYLNIEVLFINGYHFDPVNLDMGKRDKKNFGILRKGKMIQLDFKFGINTYYIIESEKGHYAVYKDDIFSLKDDAFIKEYNDVSKELNKIRTQYVRIKKRKVSLFDKLNRFVTK